MSYRPLLEKTRRIEHAIISISRWWNSAETREKLNDKYAKDAYREKMKRAKQLISMDIDNTIDDIKENIRDLNAEVSHLRRLKTVLNKKMDYAQVYLRGD